MIEIGYGVVIDTQTSVTDTDIGLVSGVFRYSTCVVSGCMWGTDEYKSGNVTDTFYNDFITKDGLSNPSRSIDISKSGDYGTQSNFTVKIRNNGKIWNTIKTHNINMINSDVMLFAIINNTFYQIWDGVVSEVPYSPTEYIIKCSDESSSMHKNMPRDSILNKVKPVLIGDVEYIKATRIQDTTYIQLMSDNISCPIYNAIEILSTVEVIGTLDEVVRWNIYLLTQGKVFAVNELKGKYLKIAGFNSTPEDDISAVDDGLVYIYSSLATVVINGFHVTQVVTKQAPLVDPPFEDRTELLPYTYVENIDDITTGLVNKTISDFSLTVYCVDLNNNYVLSQSGVIVDTSELYSYDEDSDSYIKLLANIIDNHDGTISLDNPTDINQNSFLFYYPLDFEIKSIRTFLSGPEGRRSVYSDVSYYNHYDYLSNGTSIYDPVTETITGEVLHLYPGAESGVLPWPASGEYFEGFIDSIEDSDKAYGTVICGNISGEILSFWRDSVVFPYTFDTLNYTYRAAFIESPQIYTYDFMDHPINLNSHVDILSNNYLEFKEILTNKSDQFTPKYGPAGTPCVFAGIDVFITLDENMRYSLDSDKPKNTEDELYVLLDFRINNVGNLTSTGDGDWYHYITTKWSCRDKFGKLYDFAGSDTDSGLKIRISNKANESKDYDFREIPEHYYNGNVIVHDINHSVTGLSNFFNDSTMLDGDGDVVGYDGYFGSELFKVPDRILQLYKDGTLNSLKVSFEFEHSLRIGDYTTPQWTIQFRQLAVMIKRKQDLKDNLYLKTVSTNVNTSTVYDAFKYILETNDEIDTSNINYNNLPTYRSDNWLVGRQIDQVRNSKDYLSELAMQSYVAMFPDRRGRRSFNCWLDNASGQFHNDSLIVRDTFNSVEYTPIRNIYNQFNIEYEYDYGKGDYSKQINIKNTDVNTYDASYVEGISTDTIAEGLWEVSHSGYLISGTSNAPEGQYSQLPWYSDNSSDYKTPVLYLTNLINWTSRQHLLISHSIPITASGLLIELTDPVYINNYVLTNNNYYQGWITDITYNIKNNKIELSSIVDPSDNWVNYTYPITVEDVYIIDSYYGSLSRTNLPIFNANGGMVDITHLIDRTKNL